MDISVGEFIAQMHLLGDDVVNFMDSKPPTPLRSSMAVIAKANCVFTLDTGPLYVAEALRVPAISIWGPHDPGVRIGYDPDYMDLAVWNEQACSKCPCYCFGSFPQHKCPRGAEQTVCEVLASVTVDSVLTKLDAVECRRRFSLGSFPVKA